MVWLLVGFIIGVILIKLQPKVDRWISRQEHSLDRKVLEARLNELHDERLSRMRNGRESGDLTAKIDPVS